MNVSQQIMQPGMSGRSLVEVGDNLPTHHDRVDISKSISFLQRHFWLIAAVVAACMLAGALASVLMPKTYTATAVTSLETKADDSVRTEGQTPAEAPDLNASYVETQVEIITSREMATRVANALGLTEGLDDAERRELIDDLQENVSAGRTGESYALYISYDADTPEAAADIANEYAQQFTQWNVLATQSRSGEQIETIRDRLDELQSQAQEDTAALQSYRIANNLLSTSGSSLTEQEISSYNQEVTRARAQASEAQARLNTATAQLRSGSSGEDVGAALGSGVIGSLRSQESTLAGQVANLSARYGPNHPELVRTKADLAEVRSRIQAEINRVISNLRSERDVANQRLASLTSSLGSAQAKLSASNKAMVGLSELERRAEASQGLYEAYLSSYKQLLAAEGTERPDARIITLAEVPIKPSAPNTILNMALSLVLGVGLGIFAAMIAEATNRGITTPEQIEQELGQNYLASIPLLSSVSKGEAGVGAVLNEPRSPFTEAFRSLMIAVEQQSDTPVQVIAITSTLPKEGKTVTSTCLAQVLAMQGHPTLLVDCDYVKKGVSRLLNLSDESVGLLDVLSGKAPLADAIRQGSEGLAILPIVKSDERAESLMSGPDFEEFLTALRQGFKYVILDLPPVLPIAATRSIAQYADTTIMLARWRSTTIPAVQAALRQLPRGRVSRAGIALTQVDLKKRGLFSKRDPNFYYKEYREYYA
ncbi:GumC family protein [Croceicoccus mobilis]|uniref:non-specific protein-tyrosine kinase n=1 Tax=Croceicoccus mobilis TaxID=1703339 RepID=A0A916Z3P7_9SPHN|nr:polysaccharide biosynthesis tyrosine autokinase [Croceicoccus mobilis]GGD72177.1 hypothetical protein GCM10010990_22070 [Croceicoccus mobilis]